MLPVLAGIGAAASLGGGLAGFFGAKSQADKLSDIYEKYRKQLGIYSDRSLGQVLQSAPKFSRANWNADYQDAVANRMGLYSQAMGVPTGYGMMPPGSQADMVQGRQMAGRRAALTGYDDVGFNRGLTLSENAQKLMHWDSIAKLYLDEMSRELGKASEPNALQGASSLMSPIGSTLMSAGFGFGK